jgi:SOS response regulatory protein OraA/RecX
MEHQLLLKKAGDLLARRAYSRGELRDQLAKVAGAMPVEPVLDRLTQLNLLNDEDYAYNFALRRITQDHWGPEKVRRSLHRRQIAQATVERVLERMGSELGNEPVLENYLQEYWKKRGHPADLKGLRRLFLHLRSRGFEEESILIVLRRMVPPALWQRFETGE